MTYTVSGVTLNPTHSLTERLLFTSAKKSHLQVKVVKLVEKKSVVIKPYLLIHYLFVCQFLVPFLGVRVDYVLRIV